MSDFNKSIIFGAQGAKLTRSTHYYDVHDGLGYTDRELYEFDGGCFIHAYDSSREVFYRGTPEMGAEYRDHGQDLRSFITEGLMEFGCADMEDHYIFAICGGSPLNAAVLAPSQLTQEELEHQIEAGARAYFGEVADSIIEFKRDGAASVTEWADMYRAGSSERELRGAVHWISGGSDSDE